MKKFFAALIAVLACSACLLSACGNDGLFTFVSVRMKGNGDGTVTAVAQNEFALGGAEMPVTLFLYTSESYETDVAKMTLLKSVESGGLKISEKANITLKVESESYFCARIEYELDGEPQFIQSDTIYYDLQGNRSAPR